MPGRRHRDPASLGVPLGDAAQMEQIRRSLAAVATDAAEKAAEKTVERLFAAAGVDITDPKGIVKLQRVIAFGGDMLDARDTIRTTSLRTAVGLLVTGFFTIVVLGLRAWIQKS